MKSAVIGLGVIGRVHIQVLQKLNCDIVAVCDIDYSKCEKIKTGFNINPHLYQDYKKMLMEEKIDVVHICTPHYLHAEMIIFCLKNNINVLCEKPLAISMTEIDDILYYEKNSEAILGVCQQNRYNDINIYVKNYLLDKKVIGANGILFWHRDEKYYNMSPWRKSKDEAGGGVLINQALHTLDLMQWWLSFPISVLGTIDNCTGISDLEVEDTAFASFNGKNNFTFFATNTSSIDFNTFVMIKTESDVIEVFSDKLLINNKLIEIKKGDYYGKECYGNGHERLISDFYDCVKNHKKFSIDGIEAAKVMKMILAIYKSHHKIVKIN